MSDLPTFAGGNALVTGAGDGIGAMLARGLAAAGMTVCVQDIRADAAARVAKEIGGEAFPLTADVSDRDSLAVAAKTLAARDFRLNVLWLNAGVGVGAPVLGGLPNAVEWGFGVNVLGVIWSMPALWPLMERVVVGGRHVGFTASSAAMVSPEGDFPLYATTKHGTFAVAVAEALRAELGAKDIPSTILCPGLLNTDIWDAARARPERFGGERRMDPATSGYWRAAQDPVVMWPHIAERMEAGGGYLTCATDPELEPRFDARHAEIKAGFRNVFG